jgi:hypothetical protein
VSSGDVIISPLVAQIMTASLAVTHHVTDMVIDNLRTRLAYAEARAAAVEHAILGLIAGPYTPSPWFIERALFPNEEEIERFLPEVEAA